jgi:hypothetical protein
MDKYKKKYILYHPQTIIQLSISLQTTNCVNIPYKNTQKTKRQLKHKRTILFYLNNL